MNIILGYRYKVKLFNKDKSRREWHPYSIRYNTLREAKAWYNDHGIELEQMFDRKLVLKGVVEDNIAAPKLITQWAGK